jgi:hypothetical protein
MTAMRYSLRAQQMHMHCRQHAINIRACSAYVIAPASRAVAACMFKSVCIAGCAWCPSAGEYLMALAQQLLDVASTQYLLLAFACACEYI